MFWTGTAMHGPHVFSMMEKSIIRVWHVISTPENNYNGEQRAREKEYLHQNHMRGIKDQRNVV